MLRYKETIRAHIKSQIYIKDLARQHETKSETCKSAIKRILAIIMKQYTLWCDKWTLELYNRPSSHSSDEDKALAVLKVATSIFEREQSFDCSLYTALI